jgi:hypothetical protein
MDGYRKLGLPPLSLWSATDLNIRVLVFQVSSKWVSLCERIPHSTTDSDRD